MPPEGPRPVGYDPDRTASGSTRRALMRLLPAVLLEARRRRAVPFSEASGSVGSQAITFEERWSDLLEAISAQEVAIAHHDELERVLVARVARRGAANTHDPDLPLGRPDHRSSPRRFISLGEAARTIERSMAERVLIWNTEAERLSLPAAADAEARSAASVRQAASALVDQPATGLSDLRLKLATLIAVHEPGRGCRYETPWRELRLILEDVDHLLEDASI